MSAAFFCLAVHAHAEPASKVSFHRQVRPILEASCGDCHARGKVKAGLDATNYANLLKGGESGPAIVPGKPDESLLMRSISGPDPEMPLKGDPLTPGEIALIARWIAEGAVNDMPEAGIRITAAREAPVVKSRRLNRVEFNNTVRDLLGSALSPGDEFPMDGARYGFDRTGDALSTSLLHIEEFENAARTLTDELFARAADDPVRQRVLPCAMPGPAEGAGRESCAERTLRPFLERAWRRPVGTDEVRPFVRLAARPVPAASAPDSASAHDEGLRLAFQAILLSPPFHFHMEGAAGGALPPAQAAAYALASRLSYFLWSSMPDDELWRAAAAGMLQKPVELRRQTLRMLADPRAGALAHDFAAQWLMLRQLDSHAVDGKRFINWNRDALKAMQNETLAFFEHHLRNPIPARDMLTARFTFIDDLTAGLYGMEGPGKGKKVKVPLDGLPRVGLLTQPSVLTVTSHPNRTSPTGRGLWVMDRILCEPPPPPPPGIPDLPEAAADGTKGIREFLEIHRREARCKVCHEVMDTIGLGFENYNGVGQFRTAQGGEPIAVAGKLPDGRSFGSVVELAAILSEDPRFEACLSKQLLTYAVGRGFDDEADRKVVDTVTGRARAAGGSLAAFVTEVVLSEVFLDSNPRKTVAAR